MALSRVMAQLDLAFTISSMALLIYAWLKNGEWQVISRKIWQLHIISALLFVLFNTIALIGLQLTLASRTSIFMAMHPLFVVLFNYLTPSRERIGWQKLLGLGLTLVGVLIVFGDRFCRASRVIYALQC